jgi:hypothetical protein
MACWKHLGCWVVHEFWTIISGIKTLRMEDVWIQFCMTKAIT